MNQTLLAALRGGVTQRNREYISNLIASSRVSEEPLMQELNHVELAKIINLASAYIADVVSDMQTNEISWENLYGGTEITIGLRELMKNPAILNYTQAVAMVVSALLKDG